MLSGKFSLYVTGSRAFKTLKDFDLIKFDLSLGLVIQINIIFVLDIFCRRYTLFLFLKVSPQTLFLLANFFIFLLKNIRSYRGLFCN